MKALDIKISFKDKRPNYYVRIVGDEEKKRLCVYVQDETVYLVDYHDRTKCYLICDSDTFIKLVGFEFISKRLPARRVGPKQGTDRKK